MECLVFGTMLEPFLGHVGAFSRLALLSCCMELIILKTASIWFQGHFHWVSLFWENARAIFGPCQTYVWHSVTFWLSRALKVSRLGQCHLKGQSNPKISNFLLTQNKQQFFLIMIITFISSKAPKLTQKRRSQNKSPLWEFCLNPWLFCLFPWKYCLNSCKFCLNPWKLCLIPQKIAQFHS